MNSSYDELAKDASRWEASTRAQRLFCKDVPERTGVAQPFFWPSFTSTASESQIDREEWTR